MSMTKTEISCCSDELQRKPAWIFAEVYCQSKQMQVSDMEFQIIEWMVWGFDDYYVYTTSIGLHLGSVYVHY